MCLIIVKEANQRLEPEFIISVQRRNSDGWGIMWFNRKGVPSVVKGLDLFSFQKWYNKLKHKKLIIHFRMRTDGKINLDNAHPYEVVPGMYMMHNGILHGFRTGRDTDMSDTANFVAKEVRPLILEKGIDYANTPEFVTKMEKFTGPSNKLAFITPQDFLVIEKKYWKYTLSGLLVSNDYAYDVDNHSHYGREYSTPARTHSFRAGDGKYGQVTTSNNVPAVTHTRFSTVEQVVSANKDVAAGLNDNDYHDDEYDNWDDYPLMKTNQTPPVAKLAVDNSKKATLLNQDGEPITTTRSKTFGAMTDAEFAEFEREEAANSSSYGWLEQLSNSEIIEYMRGHPGIIAKCIKDMFKDIKEYGYAEPSKVG